MKTPAMSLEDAYQAIYDVLVKRAKARESNRDSFVHYMRQDQSNWEWRFQGDIGFGAKFYRDSRGFRVGCYPEERTAKINTQIERMNAELILLWEKVSG